MQQDVASGLLVDFRSLRFASLLTTAISLSGCHSSSMLADLAVDANTADAARTQDARSSDAPLADLLSLPDLPSELSFMALAPLAGIGAARAVAIGDINLDGKQDVVVGQETGTQNVVILLGKGDGTFQTPTYQALESIAYPGSMLISDLNADGNPDCAIADRGAEAVSVLLGHGDGTFSPMHQYGQRVFAGLAAGDLNGGGTLDLVTAANPAAAAGPGTLSVLLGKGDGTFAVTVGATSALGMTNLAMADLNGDGQLDVVAPMDDGVSVFLGKGDGTFTEAKTLALPGADYAIAVADLNGDGKPDIVGGTDGTVQVFLGHGDGTFSAPTSFMVMTTGLAGPIGTAAVAIADLDGDGQPDLAVLNPSGVGILLGNGQGAFGAPQYFSTPSTSSALAIHDLNGDGQPDIVVVGQYLTVVLLNESR